MRVFPAFLFVSAVATVAIAAEQSVSDQSAPAAASPVAASATDPSCLAGGGSGREAPEIPHGKSAASPAAPAPRFRGIPENRREYVEKLERMKRERDAAQLGAMEARSAATGRRESILAENPEAKALSEKIASLQAELAAATNALEELLRADESLASLSAAADKAEESARKSQWELQEAIASAVRERQRRANIPDFSAFDKGSPAAPQDGRDGNAPAVRAFDMTPPADSAATNAVRRRQPPRFFNSVPPMPPAPEAHGPGETAVP